MLYPNIDCKKETGINNPDRNTPWFKRECWKRLGEYLEARLK